MYVTDILKQSRPALSFEIFPPKKDSDIDTIYNTIDELTQLKPDFISVTYSAGGGGNNLKTLELAQRVQSTGTSSVAHLTCISSSKEEIRKTIKKLKEKDIVNILALRGDLPVSPDIDIKQDYLFAKDLIQDLCGKGFCIGAAAYPEGHIECDDTELNIEHLKQKVEQGAEFLITQLFFDNQHFYSFINKVRQKNINIPIIPGIMPFMSKVQLQKMIFMCGASLPTEIIKILYKYEKDPEGLKEAGIEYAARQCNDLIENGSDGIHLYTMNQAQTARKICGMIHSWGDSH